MTKALAGRIALVTGASRGIGKAAAIGLAAEGAHVVDVDAALLAVVAQAIGDGLVVADEQAGLEVGQHAR